MNTITLKQRINTIFIIALLLSMLVYTHEANAQDRPLKPFLDEISWTEKPTDLMEKALNEDKIINFSHTDDNQYEVYDVKGYYFYDNPVITSFYFHPQTKRVDKILISFVMHIDDSSIKDQVLVPVLNEFGNPGRTGKYRISRNKKSNMYYKQWLFVKYNLATVQMHIDEDGFTYDTGAIVVYKRKDKSLKKLDFDDADNLLLHSSKLQLAALNYRKELLSFLKDIDWTQSGLEIINEHQGFLSCLKEFRDGKHTEYPYLVQGITLKDELLGLVFADDFESKQLKTIGIHHLTSRDTLAHKQLINTVIPKYKQELGIPVYEDYDESYDYYECQWSFSSFIIRVISYKTNGMNHLIGLVEKDTPHMPDFRQSKWGDSKEAVQTAELEDNIWPQEENLFAFRSIIYGYNCIVVYIFENNKLVGGKYYIIQSGNNIDEHITRYERITHLAAQEHGQFIHSSSNKTQSHYNTQAEAKGFATDFDYMRNSMRWSLKESYLDITLSGNSFEVLNVIQYTPKKIKDTLEKKIWIKLKEIESQNCKATCIKVK